MERRYVDRCARRCERYLPGGGSVGSRSDSATNGRTWLDVRAHGNLRLRNR